MEPKRYWIQKFDSWNIGVWRHLWMAKDPLPRDLETKEFGECEEFVLASAYGRIHQEAMDSSAALAIEKRKSAKLLAALKGTIAEFLYHRQVVRSRNEYSD